MNKQQLAAKIWESANKMRSKIEANEYKDYILGFIFYKFLSENEISRMKRHGLSEGDLESLTEENTELVSFVKDECGYFIAYPNLFSTWIAEGADFEIGNVYDALSAFNRNIEVGRRKVFAGIFDTLQTGLSKLGTDARSQTKAVRDLLYLIKDIPMDDRQDYDVLGYIYEYLIDKFASNAGKKAGEFYTPHEVSQLMSEIVAWHLRDRDEIEIYDPTSGSGSLLITIGQAVARCNGDPDSIKYYAQELKENTYNLTRMNLVMRGILPDNIVTRNGDTLEDDWPYFDTDENKDETYTPLYVDAVVSNPPYSQNWDPQDKEIDKRFEYGVAPKSKADYAFLLHDLYHLRPDGIMTIVLPHGVLFRGGEEGAIRRNLIEHHHIQAIIGLPPNIFFGTGIPTIIMVLRKNRADSDVLIVDASKHFVKDGKNNKLRASDIKRIVDVVTTNRSVDKFSRLVSIDEIRRNDYNLNIPRYVDSSEATPTWDVYASMFGGVPKAEIESLNDYWRAWPSLKGELFSDDGGSCLTCQVDDVAQTIRDNADVRSYIDHCNQAISALSPMLRERLVENVEQVDAMSAEDEIAHELDAALASCPLIDTYDAYQELDDAWGTISADLEIIHSEGFDAVRQVDPRMTLKKKGGRDIEIQDGWTGRVLPFELVQRELLRGEVDAIEADEARMQSIESELNEMLENLTEEEKGDAAINEDGDGFVAAELKREVKAIGRQPSTEFERSLVQAQSLVDESKRLKNAVKRKSAALEDHTRQVIEQLDDADALNLLEAKWITPLQTKLEALPKAIVDGFIAQVMALNAKYATTYADVCQQINTAEQELASMIGQLTGGPADMAGLAELKTLLGGE